MMNNPLYPCVSLERLTELSPAVLCELGAKAVILDVDNTMSPPDTGESYPGVAQWIELMRSSGIKLIILSNNTPERVRPYADAVGIDFICATKPMRKGYKLCFEKLCLQPNECCCVGDQLFTDILGANFAGCTSCLVEPLSPDQTSFIRFKRALEKPALKAYKKRKENKAK